MDNQDGIQDPRPPGRIESREMREILEAAAGHSEAANSRLTKLFEKYFRRVQQLLFEPQLESDLPAVWSLLKRSSEQSYKTYRRLNQLIDDYQRYVERGTPSMRAEGSALRSSVYEHEVMACASPRSDPLPKEFILRELRNAGSAGMPMKTLYRRFMESFSALYPRNPESLWATNISRLTKAREICVEDSDEGRWYRIGNEGCGD